MILSANMSAPPRLNLVGELLLIITLVRLRKWLVAALGAISFFGACYRIYLFSLRQHGVYINIKSGF